VLIIVGAGTPSLLERLLAADRLSHRRGRAAHLNRRRIFTRDGGRWGIGQAHRILMRPTYIGRHEFNTSSPKNGPKSDMLSEEGLRTPRA
jgi:hypothetical protein